MPYSDPAKKAMYSAAYRRRPEVVARTRKYMHDWAIANADKRAASEAKRRRYKRAMCLIATARTRARKRGIEFDLHQHVADIQNRIDVGVCEITGVKFDLSPGRKFNSPSLDRINPKLGYVHSNVRVVLNLMNAAMGDWGEEVLRSVMHVWNSRHANSSSPTFP